MCPTSDRSISRTSRHLGHMSGHWLDTSPGRMLWYFRTDLSQDNGLRSIGNSNKSPRSSTDMTNTSSGVEPPVDVKGHIEDTPNCWDTLPNFGRVLIR